MDPDLSPQSGPNPGRWPQPWSLAPALASVLAAASVVVVPLTIFEQTNAILHFSYEHVDHEYTQDLKTEYQNRVTL